MMAKALESGRDARTSHRLTHHVLDALTAFDRSSQKSGYEPLSTRYTRAEPMKNNPLTGVLDV